MEVIPDEILIEIFKFIPELTKICWKIKNLRLVCRKWDKCLCKRLFFRWYLQHHDKSKALSDEYCSVKHGLLNKNVKPVFSNATKRVNGAIVSVLINSKMRTKSINLGICKILAVHSGRFFEVTARVTESTAIKILEFEKRCGNISKSVLSPNNTVKLVLVKPINDAFACFLHNVGEYFDIFCTVEHCETIISDDHALWNGYHICTKSGKYPDIDSLGWYSRLVLTPFSVSKTHASLLHPCMFARCYNKKQNV